MSTAPAAGEHVHVVVAAPPAGPFAAPQPAGFVPAARSKFNKKTIAKIAVRSAAALFLFLSVVLTGSNADVMIIFTAPSYLVAVNTVALVYTIAAGVVEILLPQKLAQTLAVADLVVLAFIFSTSGAVGDVSTSLEVTWAPIQDYISKHPPPVNDNPVSSRHFPPPPPPPLAPLAGNNSAQILFEYLQQMPTLITPVIAQAAAGAAFSVLAGVVYLALAAGRIFFPDAAA